MNAPVLVDAHHHLWDLSQRPQPWLDDPAVASIRRTFTPGDLRSTATHPIAGRRLHGTVVVQCVAEVAESEDLLALAGFAAGLIHGLLAGDSLDRALACGTAHGALVMTTPGDVSMATLAEVEALLADGSAHVRR